MTLLIKITGLLLLLSALMACPTRKRAVAAKNNAASTLPSTASIPSSPCQEALKTGLLADKMNGISLVAPPKAFQSDPIKPLQELGAGWVALLPYAYFQKNNPNFNPAPKNGWWGERVVGIKKSTEYAHQQGLRVMLKPQLWTHDQWIGDLIFENEADWTTFEGNYRQLLLRWARVADSLSIEMLCVGTELRHVANERPTFWRQLIHEIRLVYKGKLTYAPNWDSYQQVTFWDALDYIGVDAYFPLLENDTPSVCALKAAWQPYVQELETFAEKWQKPMLFTEYGYLSLDGAAHKTWVLEKNRQSANINELAQANAIQALLETFGEKAWWSGGFLWKWYPTYHSSMGEGHYGRDYTPQNKQAQQVLKQLFQKP